MGTLYENIKALCDQRGIKPGKMCVDVGISKGLISDLKAGRKKSIQIETAKKIADYFDVPISELTDGPGLNTILYQTAKDNGLDKAAQLLKYGEIKQPISEDGLSDNKLALIELVKMLPEDKAAMSLRVLRSILEGD